MFIDEKLDEYYLSKYAPNINLKIKKSQINKIIQNRNIDNVYLKDYVVSEDKMFYDTMEDIKEITSNNSYDTWYFDSTGITEMHNSYNLYGSGVKIATIEGFIPNKNLSYFSNMNLTTRTVDKNYVSGVNTTNNHMNYTTSVMAAQTSNYIGAILDAQFYSASVNVYNDGNAAPNGAAWQEVFEWAMDQGVSVITSSIILGNDSEHTYGDSSKWLEHIANEYSVTFIMAGPNSDNFRTGTMAYNTILVGNSNSSNVLQSNYLNNSSEPYKPDIMAPGTNIQTPEDTSSGASIAAPLVASVAVQLIQRYPYLSANPALIKTLILNGATYTGNENTMNSTNSFVAFKRNGGAGVLNASKSLIDYSTRNWASGTFTDKVTSSTTTFYVDSKLRKVNVTVCSLVPITKSNYILNIPFATFKITVKNGNNKWVSVCDTDNKCSVRFTPPNKGDYTVIVERTDNNSIDVKSAIVYTSDY